MHRAARCTTRATHQIFDVVPHSQVVPLPGLQVRQRLAGGVIQQCQAAALGGQLNLGTEAIGRGRAALYQGEPTAG